jgi:rubredoxin
MTDFRHRIECPKCGEWAYWSAILRAWICPECGDIITEKKEQKE